MQHMQRTPPVFLLSYLIFSAITNFNNFIYLFHRQSRNINKLLTDKILILISTKMLNVSPTHIKPHNKRPFHSPLNDNENSGFLCPHQ